MSKRGRGGRSGTKLKISACLPVAATLNCADNTGAKALYIIAVTMIQGRQNRLQKGSVGELMLASVKKGKPELRKKVMPAVIIRQRKAYRRREGYFLYFEGKCVQVANLDSRQRRRHREPKGRDERICHFWTSRKGVLRALAKNRRPCWLNCMMKLTSNGSISRNKILIECNLNKNNNLLFSAQ